MNATRCARIAAVLIACMISERGFCEDIIERAKQAPVQPLWPGSAPDAKGATPEDIPKITVCLPPESNQTGVAVVVCPGGGYGGLAMDHEGFQIAAWLNENGIAAFILQYRLGPQYGHPVPLHDAQRAIRTVRHEAANWRVNPEKIGILGFSAGGHLTSTAGTHFDAGNTEASDPIEKMSSRPDFMVLLYPVITMTHPYTHLGSRGNLLGKEPSEELIDLLSNEKQVTENTPPAFLVHTSEDTAVPPQNSVMLYLALKEANVPAEMHIFEKGAHGLGLGGKDAAFRAWPGLCIEWLRVRGFLKSEK